MVTHLKQSIKNLNDKKRREQDKQDEVTEIRDAVIEIAELVSELYSAAENENKEDGENG